MNLHKNKEIHNRNKVEKKKVIRDRTVAKILYIKETNTCLSI